MNHQKNKWAMRDRRHRRVRDKVKGAPVRPRLAVYRSLRHMYAQIIDDTVGRTLVAVSTLTSEVVAASAGKSLGNKASATVVGKKIAELARARGIEKVVFDRGGYKYHGRIKALADAAREGGLKF